MLMDKFGLAPDLFRTSWLILRLMLSLPSLVQVGSHVFVFLSGSFRWWIELCFERLNAWKIVLNSNSDLNFSTTLSLTSLLYFCLLNDACSLIFANKLLRYLKNNFILRLTYTQVAILTKKVTLAFVLSDVGGAEYKWTSHFWDFICEKYALICVCLSHKILTKYSNVVIMWSNCFGTASLFYGHTCCQHNSYITESWGFRDSLMWFIKHPLARSCAFIRLHCSALRCKRCACKEYLSSFNSLCLWLSSSCQHFSSSCCFTTSSTFPRPKHPSRSQFTLTSISPHLHTLFHWVSEAVSLRCTFVSASIFCSPHTAFSEHCQCFLLFFWSGEEYASNLKV